MNEKLELLTPGNCQLIFIDHQPQMPTRISLSGVSCYPLERSHSSAPASRGKAGQLESKN